MYPGVRFDQPGKSPFMDMDLQPRYAEEEGGSGMRIDPAQVQNLAVRTERARKGKLSFSKDIPANLNFNDYQLSRIQSRAEGFVEKTYSLAVGDTIRAGEPLADITVPGWASDQSEYLLLKTQNAAPAIVRGVRERLRLSGMPEDMLKAVDATGRVQTRMTIHSPLGGVITELDVYPGMNVGKEMTIATVRGIVPIWVTAEVPERDLWMIGEGRLRVSVLAWPDRAFYSSSHTLLPRASEETRTVPLRLSLENGEGLLRPGMTASVRLRGRGEEAVLIPTQALIDLGHEQRVITRQADGSFLPKLVKVLRTGGESAALSSGLEAGEEVVIFGLFLIDSEANLRGALERMRLDGESGAAMAGVGRREESSEGESSRASSGGGQGRESAENAGALSGAEKE
jgi:Cu(I)/Ag(I) efflux system membrane fusion protein